MNQVLAQVVQLHGCLLVLALQLLGALNGLFFALLLFALPALKFVVFNPTLDEVLFLSEEDVV